ncbi:MAG: hypothetical protein AB8B66_01395 [Rickettsiaceae bacterium]
MSEHVFEKKILNSPEEKQIIMNQIHHKFALIGENTAELLADIEFIAFQYWQIDSQKFDELASHFSKVLLKNHNLMISYLESLD